MEAASSMRRQPSLRTFQPETGALARKLMNNLAPCPNTRPYAAKWQPNSPVDGAQSPKMAKHYEAKSMNLKPFREMPATQTRLATSASVPSMRLVPDKGLRCPPKLGSESESERLHKNPLGRSASQSQGTMASMENLVKAAQRRMHELPSIAETKRAANMRVTPAFSQQGSSMRVAPSHGHQRAPDAKPVNSVWSTKEENKQFADELARLGRPTDPMKWANDDIENKWLKREAVFEMFKSFMDFGSAEQENGTSTTACDSSRRSLTPGSSSSAAGLEFEHDALSNFVGQDILCRRH